MIRIPQYDLDGLGGEFLATEEIEKRIASFVGSKHCIMVSNGTVALFLALKAVEAKHVAIPVLTMFGTAAAAELAQCTLHFVANNELPPDVDTYIHVSINGRAEGIDEVILKYPGVTVIEDAAQSLGSLHQGKYLGTFGRVGCYSFSPHKIISAGNGGCVVTNDDDIALKVRALKNFGRASGGADIHETVGYNFKFSDIQARFMLEQFATIEERIEKKKHIYATYYERLSACMISHEATPWFVDYYVHGDRDDFIRHMTESGIGTRKMYPLLTTQKPFLGSHVNGEVTVSEHRSTQGVWLPSSFALSDNDISEVIAAVESYAS